MEMRSWLRWVVTLGALCWPIGVFGFGGPDDPVGRWIVGIGSLAVLAAFAAELLLRRRAAGRRGGAHRDDRRTPDAG